MTARLTWLLTRGRSSFAAVAWLAVLFCFGCTDPAPGPAILTADVALHLEDHLEAAAIVGSEVPADLPQSVEWRFDRPQSDWKPSPRFDPVEPVYVDDALRLPLTGTNGNPGRLWGEIYVELPDWSLQDWSHVEIRARASDPTRGVGLVFNYTEEVPRSDPWFPWYSRSPGVPLVSDGTVQTYRLPLQPRRSWEGPWTDLGIWFNAQPDQEAVSIDLLSVSIIPKETIYADAPVGVRREAGDSQVSRRALYTHAPGRVEYRVRVPDAGRLDVGLGVIREDAPVTFRITAEPDGGEADTLLDETYADQKRWAQRTVDLSRLAGQTVTLVLEADGERPGTVALWAAPTLSGASTTDKPNIIFYIIDGAGADLMSVYGYNRRTTPHLERLAAEGAVFEYAYSNSSYTRPSTPSFLTSLQHSVLGGSKNGRNSPPPEVLTMAEHLHHARYQTALFTTNPNAGSMSNLDRGNDWFRDTRGTLNSTSSVELHEDFWRWREAYPAEPYWVHFQTTDVHRPWRPVAPFAGLYVSLDSAQRVNEWTRQLQQAGGGRWWTRFDNTDISLIEFYHAARGLYDETMAHNDYQIGQLVERLKAEGEWEDTLFIVAADHSHLEAGLPDPLLPRWEHWNSAAGTATPMFRTSVTRIPMIVVWPERIAPGQRFSHPVSMIDMLPTILELAGLPMPEIMQGQSLAPLLLGEDGWEPRPVILDEFYVDPQTGEFEGLIEVIDGRWGASLEINPDPARAPEERRPAPLVVYDLWNDPMCLHSLHEERPNLVEKYTEFLEAQWAAHQALAQQFTRREESPLTPEQLRTLRSLGYIR